MTISRWSTAVALLLAPCLALAAAGSTGAHTDELAESEPSGGDVLVQAPEQVRLRFDEPVRFEESGGSRAPWTP